MSVQAASNKMLREFGIGFGVLTLILFGLLIPWLLASSLPMWPWIVCVSFCVLALSKPIVITPFYISFSWLGMGMGKITNAIILSLTFFLLIAPIAIIRKLIGKDPLARSLDKKMKSYFKISKSRDKKHMENPY